MTEERDPDSQLPGPEVAIEDPPKWMQIAQTDLIKIVVLTHSPGLNTRQKETIADLLAHAMTPVGNALGQESIECQFVTQSTFYTPHLTQEGEQE